MDVVSGDRLLELAHRLVEVSPATETEVIAGASCDRFARFAASGPTQSADRVLPRVQVRVRVERGGGLAEAQAVCGKAIRTGPSETFTPHPGWSLQGHDTATTMGDIA